MFDDERIHKPTKPVPKAIGALLLLLATTAAAEFCDAPSNGIGDALIDSVTAALHAAKCALTDSSAWPPDFGDKPHELQNLSYDYIVIGAGSAGSIVASRLSENPNITVLLLEAGLVPPLESEIPNLSGTLHQDARYMWLDEGVPNAQCCQAMKPGHGCRWPHGRMLGGTGAINGNFFVPGSQQDFDGWQQHLGLLGWDWRNVSLIYRQLKADKLKLSYQSVLPLNKRLAELLYGATAELGVQRMRQPLAVASTGGYTDAVPVTIHEGRRASSARQYLATPLVAQRANLHVLRGALVERVIFNASQSSGQLRARGVSYRLLAHNISLLAWARQEIVLSAGAINSPKLLLQSGIGPAAQLRAVGVQPLLELPVGENLHDHGMLPLLLRFNGNCAVNSSLFATPSAYDPASVAQYLLAERSGVLAAGFSMMGFINSSAPHASTEPGSRADLHIVSHTLLPLGSTGSFDYLGFRDDLVAAQQAELQTTDLLQIIGSLLLPQSRGQVRLRSSNPLDAPLILNNYGAHEADQAVLLRFVRYVQRLTLTRAFRRCGLQLWRPPLQECDQLRWDSNTYWLCFIRYFYVGAWHAVGSCRMGAAGDARAVLDARLRVLGIDGLRVIDASVMPEITAGNTNAPTLMIAEKGARMIQEDRR